MPTYQFDALDEAGKPQKGSISAATSDEAISKIRGKGLFPTAVRRIKRSQAAAGGEGGEPSAKKKMSEIQITIPFFDAVSQKDLTTFTRQLCTLQDAGLPILRSLEILREQQKPGQLRKILTQIHEDIAGGSQLSDAMAKHPKCFDILYTKMIAAGELGGVLDLILQRLADFLEAAAALKSKIKSAMMYPCAVISVAGVIVLGIMLFIVPSFIQIFEDFDSALPLMTLLLIKFSSWLGGPLLGYLSAGAPVNEGQIIPGVIYLLFVPPLAIMGFKAFRKVPFGKMVVDKITLRIPVLGMLVIKSTIARFTRTLGTLIGAGVPILDAINITADTTGNYVYQKALLNVHDSVRQGESFAEPLRAAKVCDPMVTNMIDVGEETGDMDKMLMKIADNYDEEVNNAVDGLVSLLEPIMVVVLGGIVGFIVIALFLPLVTRMQSVM